MKAMHSLPLLALLPLALPTSSAAPTAAAAATVGGGSPDICHLTAVQARRARLHGVVSDLFQSLGSCINLTAPCDRLECLIEAFDAASEGYAEALDQFDARLDLCALVGGGAYDPVIDPDDFDVPLPNPYYPLVPGTSRTYVKAADDPDETETIVVTVTDETREILGVECRIVSDIVMIGDEVVEDTLDYYATDNVGNVWYFGEIAMNFEDGTLVDLDGSWEAGRDGAKAGILVAAAPVPWTTTRQEFLLGEAEDAATVLALDAMVSVPFGSFTDCLQTLDFTPLEPGAEEHKFYAPGIGVVLEIDLETGERVELVGVTP